MPTDEFKLLGSTEPAESNLGYMTQGIGYPLRPVEPFSGGGGGLDPFIGTVEEITFTIGSGFDFENVEAALVYLHNKPLAFVPNTIVTLELDPASSNITQTATADWIFTGLQYTVLLSGSFNTVDLAGFELGIHEYSRVQLTDITLSNADIQVSSYGYLDAAPVSGMVWDNNYTNNLVVKTHGSFSNTGSNVYLNGFVVESYGTFYSFQATYSNAQVIAQYGGRIVTEDGFFLTGQGFYSGEGGNVFIDGDIAITAPTTTYTLFAANGGVIKVSGVVAAANTGTNYPVTANVFDSTENGAAVWGSNL